jgi:hypothetical protein
MCEEVRGRERAEFEPGERAEALAEAKAAAAAAAAEEVEVEAGKINCDSD